MKKYCWLILVFALTSQAFALAWNDLTPRETSYDIIQTLFQKPDGEAVLKNGEIRQMFELPNREIAESGKLFIIYGKDKTIRYLIFLMSDIKNEIDMVSEYGGDYKMYLSQGRGKVWHYYGQGLSIIYNRDLHTARALVFYSPKDTQIKDVRQFERLIGEKI